MTNLHDIECANIDWNDYPDFCDAYIIAAKSNERDLTDNELEALNDNKDLILQLLMEHLQ